jgi:lambda family phage portal protein
MGILSGAVAPRIRAQSFRGAIVNRLTADWIAAHLSADEEVKESLYTLRGRSRELVRNNAWARKYITLVVNNVVGHQGIMLQARITRPNGKQNKELNKTIEKAWRDWGRKGNPTVDGKLSWRDVQRLAMKTVPMDGEFFTRKILGAENPYGFSLQTFDADQLDEGYNVTARSDNEPEIRMGVEVDPLGQPISYHFWTSHPSEIQKRRERQPIPAEEIIHLYDPYRVNQTRGVPWFSSVLSDLNMLRGYQENEFVASRAAAGKMGFFTRDADAAGSYSGDERKLRVDVEPGVLDELNTAFGDFITSALRSIASGMGVSFTSLANDLSEVNFSSIRAGLLDERDNWKVTQQWLIEHLCWPVYREWVRMARLKGVLDLRIPLERYYEVEWQPRGWDWVDPLKDVQSAALAIKNRLNSRRNIAGSQGRDLEDVLDDLQTEQQMIRDRGLAVEGQTEDSSKPSAEGARAEVLAAIHGGGNGQGQ